MRCHACGSEGQCKFDCPVLLKLKEFSPKVKTEFSGSSPPEIFVGRFNYPQVNVGIISPAYFGDTEKLSMPERWFENKFSIEDIFRSRSSMIYSRFKSPIKFRQKTRNFSIMQEVAMAEKPADMEFFLKRKPSMRSKLDKIMPMVGNPAILNTARFQQNVKINKKVDYLTNDSDAKSNIAINELHKSRVSVSNIIKVLSAGLLGGKKQRKLVPTRWSVTAVDSNISKTFLEDIRHYSTIQDFRLFNSEYLGNHYEILMIPQQFSFEVIEAKMAGSIWNPRDNTTGIWKDHESYYGRKDYAENVGGGYYAVRLPVTEYLNKIKRQATVFVMREVHPEYNLPCGVGILREVSRHALSKKYESFSELKSALATAQARLRLPIANFTKQSRIINEMKNQTKLNLFNS